MIAEFFIMVVVKQVREYSNSADKCPESLFATSLCFYSLPFNPPGCSVSTNSLSFFFRISRSLTAAVDSVDSGMNARTHEVGSHQ